MSPGVSFSSRTHVLATEIYDILVALQLHLKKKNVGNLSTLSNEIIRKVQGGTEVGGWRLGSPLEELVAPWSDNGIGKALRRELRPERDSTARGMKSRGQSWGLGPLWF